MTEARTYAYINGRIRAQKTSLLSRETLLRLAALPDTAAVVSELALTSYAPEVQALGPAPSGPQLDRAVGVHLRRTLGTLRAWAAGGQAPELAAVLSRGDIEDLKTVVRGKANDCSETAIRAALCGLGNLPVDAWEGMILQPDVEGCLSVLQRWRPGWADALAVEWFEGSARSIGLEEVLDRIYYRELLRGRSAAPWSSGRILTRFARKLIDLANLRTLVRAHGHPPARIDAGPLFLQGGSVRLKSFSELLEHGFEDEVVLLLPVGRLRELALEAAARLRADGRASAERHIDREEVRLARELYRGPALSIAPTLAWIWEKLHEGQMVRLLLRGKCDRVPAELFAAEVLNV